MKVSFACPLRGHCFSSQAACDKAARCEPFSSVPSEWLIGAFWGGPFCFLRERHLCRPLQLKGALPCAASLPADPPGQAIACACKGLLGNAAQKRMPKGGRKSAPWRHGLAGLVGSSTFLPFTIRGAPESRERPGGEASRGQKRLCKQTVAGATPCSQRWLARPPAP